MKLEQLFEQHNAVDMNKLKHVVQYYKDYWWIFPSNPDKQTKQIMDCVTSLEKAGTKLTPNLTKQAKQLLKYHNR